MLRLLYRGPLVSCNFDCGYCPFGKATMTRDELAIDAAALERFTDWVIEANTTLGVFFTPWGESLIHRHQQAAIAQLSRLGHVEKVAIQTNLSCRFDWLDACDSGSLAIWATWHPAWMPLETFLDGCAALRSRGVQFSAGIVGLRENFSAAEALRERLPDDTYVWINAVKSLSYTDGELEQLRRIDPLFVLNTRRWPSRGHLCAAGRSVLSVDGDGDVRRCHFVPEVLGNLYDGTWRQILRDRPCPNDTCGCHIGYVHLDRLGLGAVFGDGVLERVPVTLPLPSSPTLDPINIGRNP